MKFDISCKKVCNGLLIHILFDKQKDMNETFMRISEYIESPIYKGKFSTQSLLLEETPDYLTLVYGHNIPGHQYIAFQKEFNYCFYPKEKEIFDIIDNLRNKHSFYVIATFKLPKESFQAIDHEIAHALFYLDKGYKKDIINILFEHVYNFRPIEDILEYKKYARTVWLDEIQAYLLDLGLGYKGFFYGRTVKDFIKRLFLCKIRFHFQYNELAQQILSIYNKYKVWNLIPLKK